MEKRAVFRPAPERPPLQNLLRTAAQAAAFWWLFLGAAPAMIFAVEQRLQISGFAFPGQPGVALLFGVLFGAVNLWSGAVMAIVGRGTPFPLDAPPDLVVRGPYRFVRNPMAIGGLGVGGAVSLWAGSFGGLAYVVVGGILWQLVARPREERDLSDRFGEAYARYQSEVRCWWPRLRGYRS